MSSPGRETRWARVAAMMVARVNRSLRFAVAAEDFCYLVLREHPEDEVVPSAST